MSDSSSTPRPSASARPVRVILGIAGAAAVIGTVAAATLTGGAAAADTSGETATHPAQVLHFGVDFSPPNVIDVPPVQRHPGDYQPGDYVTFSDVLRNGRGTAVGTEAGSGLITRIDATSIQVYYSMAVQLPGGQLAAQGISSNAPTKHLAIVGGTGRYVDASGDLQLVENGDGTGRLTLTLR
jgi:Allene oxide cyclase barrel like domain